MRTSVSVPSAYSLHSVLLSHGWSGLPPFVVDDNHQSVSFIFRGTSKPVAVKLSQKKNSLEIESKRKLNKNEIQIIRTMFGLDKEFDDFFDLAHRYERPWIKHHQMGRMLRAESVFEDLVKLILTTNCTWGLTKIMVKNLCENLGEKVGDRHSFPTPEKMAKKNETYYRNIIKAGYRAPHLVTISKMVTSRKLDIESWATDQRPYEVLRKEILELPGAGPYVAENLLRLLGKFDGLGVDSWVRGRLQKMWNMKKQPTDGMIMKKYKNYGEYKGLILWCDVTRDWHEGTETFD